MDLSPRELIQASYFWPRITRNARRDSSRLTSAAWGARSEQSITTNNSLSLQQLYNLTFLSDTHQVPPAAADASSANKPAFRCQGKLRPGGMLTVRICPL